MQISFSRVQISISRMQISFSRPLTGCKFHSVGRQPDANCIRLAAIQQKISKFIKSLHAAGDQPNEICIRLTANWMQNFASTLGLHFYKLLHVQTKYTYKNKMRPTYMQGTIQP
jgi:hypothetical protein